MSQNGPGDSTKHVDYTEPPLFVDRRSRRTLKINDQENSADIYFSNHKFSSQLLKSIEIIKQTTDSLLNAKSLTSQLNLTNPLEELLAEIHKLEAIVSDDQSRSKGDVQAALEFMAFYDSLTRLPNRPYFEKLVQDLIASNISKFYLIFIDVDNFKSINDTYGHDIGDELLKCIGQRLKSHLRDDDIVARYGGDEFVALVYPHSTINIRVILDRLVQASETPFSIKGRQLLTTLSFGVAEYPSHAQNLQQLVTCADKAMYLSKNSGKNGYTLAPSEENQYLAE